MMPWTGICIPTTSLACLQNLSKNLTLSGTLPADASWEVTLGKGERRPQDSRQTTVALRNIEVHQLCCTHIYAQTHTNLPVNGRRVLPSFSYCHLVISLFLFPLSWVFSVLVEGWTTPVQSSSWHFLTSFPWTWASWFLFRAPGSGRGRSTVFSHG